MTKDQEVGFHENARLIRENCECNNQENLAGVKALEFAECGIDINIEKAKGLRLYNDMFTKIEMCKLPIKFNDYSIAYMLLIGIDNPRKVSLLIADLAAHTKTYSLNSLDVSADLLSTIYPYGFYNEKTIDKIIGSTLFQTCFNKL